MVTEPRLGILNDISDISIYTLILTKFKQFNQFLAWSVHEFIWPLESLTCLCLLLRRKLPDSTVRPSVEPITGNFVCKFSESVRGSELNRHAALEVLETGPILVCSIAHFVQSVLMEKCAVLNSKMCSIEI